MGTVPTWMLALENNCAPLIRACTPLVTAGFPRGVEALRVLGASIEEFVYSEHASDEEERVFIEQRGALLALILIDHVGEGAYVSRKGVHRVRLCARAFFDPFAVIDATLDAEKPKRFLAEVIAKLETEARDEGPLSRVLAAFEKKLDEVRPELDVKERFECVVSLEDGTEIDLARAVEATRDQGQAAVDQAVAKLVNMLPGGEGERGIPWNEAKERILPRIVAHDFHPSTNKEAPALFLEELFSDMKLALVLQFEGKARYVRANELALWEIDAATAKQRAIANLAARSHKARFARVDTELGAYVIARTGDGLDSARLLLPGLFEVLAKELGEDMLVAVPHRDTLHACPRGNAALEKVFLARVQQDAARAPHRISDRAHLITRTGVQAAR